MSNRQRREHTPLVRVRTGALVLLVVFVASSIGFWLLGHDWVDAIWMTVITISTVGYGEASNSPPALQLFTVVVIVVGMSAAVYTFGGFFQMVLEGEFERAMGRRRVTRGIVQLNDHVIVCGYGRMGEALTESLQRLDKPFVVIDQSLDRFEDARSLDYLCLSGDATQDEILIAAGILRAEALVSALPSDADNVFITLTARHLNRDIQIIARAEHKTTEAKLRQAGADKIVSPALMGAHRMERMITRPSTAHLMEVVSETTFLDLELDELVIPEKSPLIGVTVGSTGTFQRHDLLVAAVKQPDGKMRFNPGNEYVFKAQDTVIVMGHVDTILQFQREYGL
ncbi:MAG: potassium channel protein [Pirellulaceae bacterium]|nr:potassium channel protein [Pirellulaceae bacterium]HJN10821.1 potassium channel protein [Pirellulaceae bacterium]